MLSFVWTLWPFFPSKGSSWAGFRWEKKTCILLWEALQGCRPWLVISADGGVTLRPLGWFQFFHQTQFTSYCRSSTLCSCALQSLTSTLFSSIIAIYDTVIQHRADLTILKVVIHFKSYQGFSMFFSFVASCTISCFCPPFLPLQGEVPPGSSSAWGGAVGGTYSLRFWAWHHQVGISAVRFSCPV